MEGQIKRKRLDIVDFLRGFSIFTIVLMHLVQCYPLPGFLMKASSMGRGWCSCVYFMQRFWFVFVVII